MAFLGHVVSVKGIKVDPKKIEVVHSWPKSCSATEIRSFRGLAGYYRHFLERFSSIATPLTSLMQKGFPFRSSSLFERIKERQCDDPHLLVLKDTVQCGDVKEVTIGDDGVLGVQGHICVLNVDGL
uniref:Uncharacterized mitochondrial protein AtMg00860-like n=1 Tax=Nicotiana tabacum TaxID=4097 RepID=A0A1S4BJX6_TOBAC|nr:PREDICTED: uncharacterized mitochondrial protein AtMg00860-like [Nicotiana tabacum]